MESRKEVTRCLSELVEKRITGRNMVWSREVPFDKGTSSERRVDYVAFRPFMPEQRLEPSSLELGTFEFYEIKSCIADFESGHGLTFEGDENYLVTVPDLAERLRVEHRIPDDCTAVLVPTSDWSRLRRAFGKDSDMPYRSIHRRRTAGELLLSIVKGPYPHVGSTLLPHDDVR